MGVAFLAEVCQPRSFVAGGKALYGKQGNPAAGLRAGGTSRGGG